MISVQLFGGPSLLRDSRILELTPFQGWLVAAVYGHRERRVSRTRLIELLWDEEPGPRTRHRLSQLLHVTQKQAGDASLFEAGQHTVAGSASVRSDLDAIDLTPGSLLQRARMVARGFLGSSHGWPTDRYADWVEARALSLRNETRVAALTVLTEGRAVADWSEAAAAAEALLLLDPTDLSALEHAAFALAMDGQPDRAEALIRRHEPRSGAPETLQRLSERIREVACEDPSPGQGGWRGPCSEEPLLGRREELRVLQRAIRDNRSLGTVLVTGEPGIGKSRLVREAVRSGYLSGFRILEAAAAPFHSDIPLGSLVQALTSADLGEHVATLPDPWRSVIEDLVPEYRSGAGEHAPLPRMEMAGVTRRLFEGILRLLQVVASDQGTVIVLDDAQWIDQTSLSAIAYIQRHWREGRVTFVLASRAEEPIADLLEADPTSLARLSLEPLESRASRGLVERVAGGALDDGVMNEICRWADDIPLFLIELTTEVLAGRLSEAALTSEGQVLLPPSLEELVEERVERLRIPAVSCMEMLAVFERDLSVPDLVALTGQAPEVVIQGLESAQEVRLLRWTRGRAQVRHALFAQALRERIGPPRLAWLHQRAASFLVKQADPVPEGEVALHFDRAGDRAQAHRYARRAATSAERAGAIPEAIHFLTIARRSTGDEEERTNITCDLARLHYLNRNLTKAAPLLGVAADQLRSLGKSEAAIRLSLWRVDALSHAQTLPLDDCLRELGELRAQAERAELPAAIVDALDVEIHMLDRSGDQAQVRRLLDRIAAFTSSPDPAVRCRAHRLCGFHIFYGDPRKALTSAREALRLAEQHRLEDQLLSALNGLLVTLIYQGLLRSEEGRSCLARAEAISDRSGDILQKFHLRVNRSVWHLDVGDLAKAEHQFELARKVLRGAEAPAAHLRLYCNQGDLHLQKQPPEIDRARACFSSAQKLLGPGMPWQGRHYIEAGLGMCSLLRGDLRASRFHERRLQGAGHPCTHDTAPISLFRSEMRRRRGDQRGAADLLGEAADVARARFVPSYVRLRLREAELRAPLDQARAVQLCEEVGALARDLQLSERHQAAERLRRAITRSS